MLHQDVCRLGRLSHQDVCRSRRFVGVPKLTPLWLTIYIKCIFYQDYREYDSIYYYWLRLQWHQGALKMVGGSSPPFSILHFFKCKKIFEAHHNFLVVISLRRLVVIFPKIFINLPMTYQKLNCKEEPFRFRGYLGTDRQIGRQTSCYFYIRILTLMNTCKLFFRPNLLSCAKHTHLFDNETK